jgi:hypothetical protein
MPPPGVGKWSAMSTVQPQPPSRETTSGEVLVDTHDEPHGAGDHGETHGHDDHAHLEDALGPVDWGAWAAGILGVAIGLVIAFCFVLATS